MIDTKKSIMLNNHVHKCHWRTADRTLPILISLHGGPGIPNRHSMFTNHRELCNFFTVVAYDQRGCGGSYYNCNPKTLTLDTYIEDLHALVQYFTKLFDQDKVILLGGSWGTELGTIYAHKYPEYVRAYVGYGQVVDGFLNEEHSYNYVYEKIKESNNSEDLKELEKVGPPVKGCYKPVYQGLRKQRDLLSKYGGHSMEKTTIFESLVKPVFLSGEYSIKDIYGFIKGVKFTLENSWPSIVNYNFMEDTYKFDVPIYIFQGRHDYTTPSTLIKDYYDKIEAPDKRLIWFENSAHGPLSEEKEKFYEYLFKYVLKGETYEK